MPIRYGFRQPRDGDGDDLDLDHVLRLISEEFLETGDLESAIERLLRDGFDAGDGSRVEGLELSLIHI